MHVNVTILFKVCRLFLISVTQLCWFLVCALSCLSLRRDGGRSALPTRYQPNTEVAQLIPWHSFGARFNQALQCYYVVQRFEDRFGRV